MGLSDKYGRVTTERHGKSGPIGENEPVGLFRAQDALSVPLLEIYLELCHKQGSPIEHLQSIKRQIANFRKWQAENPTRIPGTVR